MKGKYDVTIFNAVNHFSSSMLFFRTLSLDGTQIQFTANLTSFDDVRAESYIETMFESNINNLNAEFFVANVTLYLEFGQFQHFEHNSLKISHLSMTL